MSPDTAHSHPQSTHPPLTPHTHTPTPLTDVVIELDPLVYQVTEGQDRIVRFRVVKRTPTTRQVEVLFSTVDQSAEGGCSQLYSHGLLNYHTMVCITKLFTNYFSSW